MGPFKRTQSGFSLIEVLVAVAIVSVVGLAITSMVYSQLQLQRTMSQKLEATAFKLLLIQTMSNPDNCTCMMNPDNNTTNKYPLSFNEGDTNPTINLSTLYGGCDASDAPTFPMAEEQQTLASSMSSLRTTRIAVSNLRAVGGVTDEYQGNFHITFDTDGGRAIQPVILPQRFIVDSASPPAARVIIGCGALPTSTAPLVQDFSEPGAHTWIRPSQGRSTRIQCWGAGGGGGRYPGGDEGGGGGGGAYAELNVPSRSLPRTMPVIVGAGGGGSAVVADGSAGGESSFGTMVIARGGTGGTSPTPGVGGTFTAVGGTGENGATGSGGGSDVPGRSATWAGGGGGGGANSGTARGGRSSNGGGGGNGGELSRNATAGSQPGGGGGGAKSGVSGNGGHGRCTVTVSL